MRSAEISYPSGGNAKREPVLPSSVFGVIVFILTEMMFFIALISAYMISVAGSPEWPPADQPRLPAEATALNSLALLLSGFTVFVGFRAFKAEGFSSKSNKWLLATIGLGSLFVLFQGFEWAKLISFGLTMTSSSYGAFFYLIIGAHALHAIGALASLIRLWFGIWKGSLKTETYQGTMVFWWFVVGVWPVLYTLVYLN